MQLNAYSKAVTMTATAAHHEPALYRSRRFGCWATCECGRWHSKRWTTVTGAHLEYGRHLLDMERAK